MVRNLNHDIVISTNCNSNCKTYCTSFLCDDALLNYHNHDNKKTTHPKQYPSLVLITPKFGILFRAHTFSIEK